MFLMPDIYLEKRTEIGTGGIRGKVLSEYGSMPIKNAVIIAGDKTAVTDDEGNFVLTDMEVRDYDIRIQADGYNSDQKKITIVKDQVIKRDFFLTPKSAQIVGYVNVTGRFSSYFSASDMDTYVNATCSPVFLNSDVDWKKNMFTFKVPANQSKYIVRVRGLEPWFSNTITYIVPTLSPGQVYVIPDEAIQFEYNHKEVILEASTPSTPPAGSHIWMVVSGESSLLDTFELKPYGGNSYRAIVDLPYGIYTFKIEGLEAVNLNWESNDSVDYSIDDTTTKVLVHIVSKE